MIEMDIQHFKINYYFDLKKVNKNFIITRYFAFMHLYLTY